MNNRKNLSIRAYAKECGVSHVAIMKAIEAGRIVNGYDPKAKKIIPDIANQEYGFNAIIKKTNEKIKESISQHRLEEYSGVEVMDIQLMPEDSKPEAERKQVIIKAQLDLLKLKTESGELVNREEVYKQLFAYGKEIRMGLQSIPDRIVDQLITLKRNEAHKLLSENINEVLTKLSSNVDSRIS